MVANVKPLVDKTNELINSFPDIRSTADLTGTIPPLVTRAHYSVADVASLPPASENTGRFLYVEELNAYRYSDGSTWVNIYDPVGYPPDENLPVIPPVVPIPPNLWTWGCNASGQLGDGTVVSRSSPGTTAGGGTTWCQVSSGTNHSAAIKTNGTLWSWGNNTNGRLGDGTVVNRSSPVTVASSLVSWCQVSSGVTSSAAITIGL